MGRALFASGGVRTTLLAAAILSSGLGPHARASVPFQVYSWIEGFNSGKPDLPAYGIRGLELLYPEDLFVAPYPDEQNPPRQDLNAGDLAKIAARGRALQQKVDLGEIAPGTLVCIDIEHWPLFAGEVSVLVPGASSDQVDALIQSSIDKYIQVVDTLRAQAPTLRYGFYSMLPLWEWSEDTGAPTGTYYESWHADNLRILDMARKIDVLFPDLYDPFFYDIRKWNEYASGFIKESQAINSALGTHKPVVPFLFPEIWPSQAPLPAGHSDRFLPGDFWASALATLKASGADGLVIWDSNVGWRGTTPWNPDWGWWQATVNFLAGLPPEFHPPAP